MLPNKATLAAYAIVLCLTFSGALGESNNASILVFGRSGAGISSTVRMLLGRFTPPEPTAEKDSSTSSAMKSVITEYVVPIPGDSPSFLKIVDIEGVTDDRLPEDDAYIQASLKTYLTHPEGLNSQRPTAVLVVSRFDDTRYNDEQSLYVRMLKRITDVEKAVYGNEVPDINILFFARFMTEVKAIQRSPRKKLASLKSAAITFVEGILPNIATIVGENKGEDYGLTLNEDGTYRLPNRQYYPTNVFEAVANLSDSDGVSNSKSIVKIFSTLRLNPSNDGTIKASRVPFNVAPDSKDVDYFTRTIVGSGLGDIDDNEVNSALQTTYETLSDANLKTRIATIIPRLQAFLQSLNMTRLSDLPSTGLDKVKIFQSLPIPIEKDVVHILQKALNMTMPPFTQSLTVGHGYDVLTDEVLPTDSVPFSSIAINTWKFSGMGYLLPTFLSCDKLPATHIHRYMHFADTVSQSVVQRQAYLEYPNKEAFNISNFAGQLRLGFNIRPEQYDVPALSSVKEIQTHKMQLNDQIELNDKFKDSVRLLSPFDSSNRDSETEWKSFFQQWGTHVVSSGFVGGFIQGTVISDDIVAAYEDQSQVTNALERIVNFTQAEMDGVTFYGVFGGDKDPKLANVHELPAEERKEVVDKWESSLSYDPVVLNYQMGLMPISALIGRVNESLGPQAETALDLFLQGNLKYRRDRNKPRPPSGGNSVTPSKRPTKYTTVAPERTSEFSPTHLQPSPTSSVVPNDAILPEDFDLASNVSPTYESPTYNDSIVGVPENKVQTAIALRVSKWVATNKHRSDVLQSFLAQSTIRREMEMKAYEENMKIQREELEKERLIQKERQQRLDEIQRQAEEDRRRRRKEDAQRFQEQMDLQDQQRAQQLLDIQRQMNETNFAIQQMLLKQKEEREREEAKRKQSWTSKVTGFVVSIFNGKR